jgi:hypothetical protein
MSQTAPEYKQWSSMTQRCLNPKNAAFKNYGGRGIRVTESWVAQGGFAVFFAYMGPRPSADHSIGRIDNDGNYEPGNVRWETPMEQGANTRKIHPVTIDGVTKHVAQWARENGISASALHNRIRDWPQERWFEPMRPRRTKAELLRQL